MSSSHARMLRAALNRLRRSGNIVGRSVVSHREVSVTGKYIPLWTVLGPLHTLEGVVRCYYYGSEVFAIDFINKRVTDFDMRAYSISTGQNIRAWEHVNNELFKFVTADWRYRYSAWTYTDPPYCGASAAARATNYKRFCSRAPWIHTDVNNVQWFAWDKYNHEAAQKFNSSDHTLRTNQNWRYFEYVWNADGDWVVQFKNADAERRWKAREKARTKRLNDLPSNVPSLLRR